MPFQKALLRLRSPKLSSNALLINPINRRGPFAEGFRAAKAGGRRGAGRACPPSLLPSPQTGQPPPDHPLPRCGATLPGSGNCRKTRSAARFLSRRVWIYLSSDHANM